MAAAHRRLLREQHKWYAVLACVARALRVACRTGMCCPACLHTPAIPSARRPPSSARCLDARRDTQGGGPGGEAVLQAGVQVLWEVTQALPDFRKRTLHAQHVVLFSRQMVAEAERRRTDAERRKAEAEAAKAAGAAGGATAAAAADVEMVDVTGDEAPGQQQQQQQPASSPQQQQQEQQQRRQEEQQAALAAVRESAEGGAAFVPAAAWCGALPGYAFKLGPAGLGYHRDAPPEAEAYLTPARVS